MSILGIHNLHVHFPQPGKLVHAVRGVSLEVQQGEILGLVGESGCGKSISALACLGLVPSPGEVTGDIEVCGRQVVERSDLELQQLRGGTAAMIFQNPMAAMNPFFTIGNQMVEAVTSHLELSKTEARESILDNLSSVRLPNPESVLNKYPHQLSGGQLQRVMIAMALACKPKLLIADEPTTALDVTVQAQILVLIRDLARDTGLSILFITHDLGVVATLCDRVAVMYAGEIVESGSVADIYRQPGHPYTQKLLTTVPALGARESVLSAIPGAVPDLSMPVQGCAFSPRCDQATEVCRLQPAAMRTGKNDHYVSCHNAPGSLKLEAIEQWRGAV